MATVRNPGFGLGDAAQVSIPFGSSTLGPGDVVPGTGQTVQELLDIGYTPADISSILEQGAAAGLVTAPGGGSAAGPFLSISVGGKIYGASDVVQGTGQTVAELGSQGFSEADIATLIAAGQASNAAAAAAVPQGTSVLPPGPSPRISTAPPAPSSLSSALNWFTSSTLIHGVPNVALIAGGAMVLSLFGGSGRRRR